MFKEFFLNKKYFLWAWGGICIILAVLILDAYINIVLNDWYKVFYDILQQGKNATYEQFVESIKKFCLIVLPFMFIASFLNFFTRHFVFKWREAVTFKYLEKWRAHNDYIEGSSQRIQEDIQRFAGILEGLGLRVVRAFFALIVFLPILYNLSEGLLIPLINIQSGLIIWSIILCFFGLVISWYVGIKLPGLEYNNQKAEAAFRKELVFAENDRQNYASATVVLELFTGIKLNYRKLFLHYSYFDLWLSLYSQAMSMIPFVLIAPSLFAGIITYGGLMQINNAISKVIDGFSMITDNWTVITELKSVYKRLSEFEKHINY